MPANPFRCSEVKQAIMDDEAATASPSSILASLSKRLDFSPMFGVRTHLQACALVVMTMDQFNEGLGMPADGLLTHLWRCGGKMLGTPSLPTHSGSGTLCSIPFWSLPLYIMMQDHTAIVV